MSREQRVWEAASRAPDSSPIDGSLPSRPGQGDRVLRGELGVSGCSGASGGREEMSWLLWVTWVWFLRCLDTA